MTVLTTWMMPTTACAASAAMTGSSISITCPPVAHQVSLLQALLLLLWRLSLQLAVAPCQS